MGTISVLSAAEIEELLRTALVGRIACCGHGAAGDGRPYLVPLAYGYDGEAVYAHSGPGRKLDLMRAEPRVTFEVDEAKAADAGAASSRKGPSRRSPTRMRERDALRVIYPPPAKFPMLGDETVVFRIRLTALSGRHETPD